MQRKQTLSPLYARYLSSAEKKALRLVPVDDLLSEINLLRVLNALLLKIQSSAPEDLYSRIQTLRTCVIMNEQLAYLVRSHLLTHDYGSPLEKAIQEAIQSMEDDWKLA
jgi:hypothetical protein